MALIVYVPGEVSPGEGRVGGSPETVKRLVGRGLEVVVEAGAGLASRIVDADYEKAGARIGTAADAAGADVVLKVRRPTEAELAGYKPGAVVLATMDPHGNDAALAAMARAGVTGFAMELMPRITRAQVMDVLSSQANLAGYQAVIDAASEYDRALPMMMTAAGTVPAAKVFVMGAGVAGLQAIATARRLGAVVTATDVRPAAKEQVASLGAKFVAVEDEEFRAAETAAGYAKPMSAEYQARQAALVAEHIAKQDIVITTALIPGRPAPRLVSAAMVAAMKPGSVIVDLAVERGGNVEGAEPGAVATTPNGVKIVGHLNVAGRIAASASLLYAKNLLSFLETLLDKTGGQLALNREDDLVKATMLTDGGKVVHPAFAAAAALAEAAPAAPANAGPANAGPANAAPANTGPARHVEPLEPSEGRIVNKPNAGAAPADGPYRHVEAPEPAPDAKAGDARTGEPRTGEPKKRPSRAKTAKAPTRPIGGAGEA